MQPHQERVIQEKADLEEKLDKLNQFIILDKSGQYAKLDLEDKMHLNRQASIMRDYIYVLTQRIARFKSD